MKLFWAADVHGIGRNYGYSIHAKKMKEALAGLGVEITSDPRDAVGAAVHIVPQSYFRPIPGKRNILFTCCEMTEPTKWDDVAKLADLLVCPCEHNRAVFSRYYPGPIEVCPEGVDSELFPFRERKTPGPGEKFRFCLPAISGTRAKVSALSSPHGRAGSMTECRPIASSM